MQRLRHKAFCSSIRPPAGQKIYLQRRLAHDNSHGASGHGAAPVEEPLGLSFYFTLSLIPAVYLTYQLSRPSADGSPNPLTKLATKYSDWRDLWAERNARHTQIVEQAGHDRNLFLNSRQPNRVTVRFPEVFNSCAAVNVHAGGGSINLDNVIAHYRDEQFAEEEAKLQRMKEGKIPGQQPWKELPPRRG